MSQGNAALRYDIDIGLFLLIANFHVKIHCDMDFEVYPFDRQRCKFAMHTEKNTTYQEFVLSYFVGYDN